MLTFPVVYAFVAFHIYLSCALHLPREDDEEIERINLSQDSWVAAHNGISRRGPNYLRRLLGSKLSPHRLPERTDIVITNSLPSTFDARSKWPYCKSISEIKDQSNCGSCWAIAPASSTSDRICINTNGKSQIDLSAENLLSCCTNCIFHNEKGCDGGFANKAYEYIHKHGIVTGGNYNSHLGCQPYEIPPTAHRYYYQNNASNLLTPPCQKKCTNKSYKIPYKKDKYYVKAAYSIAENVVKIQSDIMEYGPVTSTFEVYDDFRFHHTGVYIKQSSRKVQPHSVKIIGWGNENGMDYWLVANSWGTDWGENGFFKIRRGTNECGFESHITAGLV